jgi:aminoglycoside phosphotransferase (APT) family kinase protein
MSEKYKVRVVHEDCAEHPAVLAWGEFSGRMIVPERIEVLCAKGKSRTYRLFGAGPSGTSIIAQWASRTRKAAVELIVYEEILPHLPVTAPRFYGFKAESPEHAWMFLEDVGSERYADTDQVQRVLAARLIGMIHSAASGVPAVRSLPDAGPPRYLNYLRMNRETIAANVVNPFLTAGEVEQLQRLIADLDALESDWSHVERACVGVPRTLVHCDFRPKNAFVRQGRNGLEILPLDWETAGWGPPAVDLTRIDLPAYTAVIQAHWRPAVRLEDVERLAAVGAVFRYLASIFWAAPQLTYHSQFFLIKPISQLKVAHERLAGAMLRMRAII